MNLIKGVTHEKSKKLWFSDPNKKRKQLASLFTSKGCVAACTFCQREAGGYRVFDLKKLDEHLEFIKNKFDVLKKLLYYS